jgi:hypothetical protein
VVWIHLIKKSTIHTQRCEIGTADYFYHEYKLSGSSNTPNTHHTYFITLDTIRSAREH